MDNFNTLDTNMREYIEMTAELAATKAVDKAYDKTVETIRKEQGLLVELAISKHAQDCIGRAMPKTPTISLSAIASDWKTIVGVLVSIAWIISSLIAAMGGSPKITPEQIKEIMAQTTQIEPH